MQGAGSGEVSQVGRPCGQELTTSAEALWNIRLNLQRNCLGGLDALTKRTSGTTTNQPLPHPHSSPDTPI